MPDSGPARALSAGRADLHLHSIFSDGLKTPEELCGMARRLGLRCLALTDHDTVSGLARMAQAASAQCAEGGPLCFIPGVEVSAGQGGRVHVLGYGADARNAPLVDFLHKSEADRREQAQKMLALLEGEGIRLSPQAREALDRPAVGRAHIARALVKKAPVYIFDDTFSALDFKTDAKLRKALKGYTEGATVLIVAQRVSTIMHAEQIVVLDEGRVMGIGTHRELLASCKTYREIAESQLSKEELA